MKISAIGRGSISSLLKVTVDIAWVLACVALGFIWIVTGISLLAMANGGGVLGVFSDVAIHEPAKLAGWTLGGSIVSVCVMIVCAYLRGVFETLVEGDPFVPANARRFRLVAITLAVMELSRVGIQLVVQGLLGGGSTPIDWTQAVNLPIWFAIVTLFVLAQVFHEGAAMREEQKMTI